MDDDLMEFVSNSYCDDDHISTLHRQDYARNVRFTNDHRFASTFSTSSGMSPSITQRQPNYIENSPFDEHDFVEDDLQEISPPNSFSASPSKFQNRRPVQVIKRSVMHAPGQSTAPANVVRYNRTLPPSRQMISSAAKTTTFRTVNHVHDPQNSSLSSGTGTRIVLVPSRNIGMAGRDRQTPDSTTTGGMSRGVIKIDRSTGNKFIQFPNGSISLIQKNRPLPQLQVGRTSSPHSRLMFDFDEEKEREISEAIAREEELMRLEEERTKGGKRGDSVNWTRPLVRNVPMTQRFQTQRFIGRNDRVGHSTTPQYQSPTQINSWDNETARTCKSVLAGIVNRVCASEEQQNRFVNISRTANNKFSDIVTLGNVRHSMPQYVQPAPVHRVYPLQYRQPEDFLIEYIESYKREVNTLRANLENIAQDELGIGMPWRRSRTKGTREAQLVTQCVRSVVVSSAQDTKELCRRFAKTDATCNKAIFMSFHLILTLSLSTEVISQKRHGISKGVIIDLRIFLGK